MKEESWSSAEDTYSCFSSSTNRIEMAEKEQVSLRVTLVSPDGLPDFLDSVPEPATESSKNKRRIQMVWRNVMLMSGLHLGAMYGLYLALTTAKWQTNLFGIFLYYVSGMLGITAGAHRLWAHRSYKAKLPLRVLLMLSNCVAWQNSIYEWARDHRVHHKFSETDADPHNSNRGFFFSHVGWLLTRKHPDVIEKGKKLDLSDLEADPVITFQRRYFKPLATFLCFVMPTILPAVLWEESHWVGYFVPGVLRYVFTLNITWLVNSAAHAYGFKPYDKKISPSENRMVSILAMGEGWHNYHHTFPQDYRTAELGGSRTNFTTLFIDFWAYLGQVYDRKAIPDEMAFSRAKRTGDGTHLSASSK